MVSAANHPIIANAQETLSESRPKISASDASSALERAYSTLARTIVFADSPYTIEECGVLHVDATGGAVTVNLPAATAGFWTEVVKTDASGNAVTVNRDGTDTIEGGTSVSLASQYDKSHLYIPSTGGTEWFKRLV